MVYRLITGFSFVALCLSTALSTGSVVAAEPGGELVKALVQEPQQALPEENAATFHKSDPRIRVQLVRLDNAAGSLAGSSVTVISPQGKTTELTADSKGLVSLSKVTSGLHAIVVSGASGHAAIPLLLREVADEASEETEAEDPALVSNDAVTTVHLPVMPIDPREVLRVATAFLPPATAAGSLADLDDQVVAGDEVAAAHLYHVVLGPAGRMEGRIVSPMLPGMPQPSLAGINVMVYSGNQLVARAITDDEGRFAAQNLRPGTHGLIAAGPAGYAAFAFDADVVGGGDVVKAQESADSQNGAALVRMNQPGAAPLPVVIIPSPMVPSVVDAIREGQEPPAVGVEPLPPGFAPVPGGGFAGGAGGAVGGGGGGLGGAAGGGLGGAGGLLALGGIGAAVAAAAASDNDDRPIVFPPVATPAEPGPVAP